MPTRADAQKWVEWADSVDAETLRRWKEVRPDFDEKKVRTFAATGVDPNSKRQANYNKVKDTMAAAGIDVDPDPFTDMATQAALAPSRLMVGLAGLPGLAERGVSAGSTALLEKFGGAPQEKIDSYRQNRKYVLPTGEDIERFATGGQMLPKPKTIPGEFVMRASDAGLESALAPISRTQKILMATGILGGGELGEKAAETIGVDPGLGRMIGEIGGGGIALGGKGAYDLSTRNPDTVASRRARRIYGDEGVQDVGKMAPSDQPYMLNTRTQNAMAKSINEANNPDQSFKAVRDIYTPDVMMDEISRLTDYKKSMASRKADISEAYNKSVDTAGPYRLDEDNAKMARDYLKYNEGFRDILDMMDKYGRTSKDKPTAFIRNIFEGNPKKSMKNIYMDPAELQRFATRASDNILKIENQSVRNDAQNVLNDFMALVASPEHRQARKMTADYEQLNQAKDELTRLAKDITAPETQVKDALSAATGVSDPDRLEDIYKAMERARGQFRVVKGASRGGSLGADIPDAERKWAEANASMLARLRQRAQYMYGQSYFARNKEEREQLIHDILVDMYNDPTHENWKTLLSKQQYKEWTALREQVGKSAGEYGRGESE